MLRTRRLGILFGSFTLLLGLILVPISSANSSIKSVVRRTGNFICGLQINPEATPAPSASNTVYVPLVTGRATTAPPPSPTPPPQTPPPQTPPPSVQNNPALVKAYLIRGPQPDYEYVKYRPRQFNVGLDADAGDKVARVDNPGPYAGWDVMNAPNREINTILDLAPWIDLTLNRSTRVAIVWRGGAPLPQWLNGWTKGADVVINGETVPTYTRSAQAGDLQLGSVYDPGAPNRTARDTYLALFAEADGKPSPQPAVPAGFETPQPNATCPAWVHDQYVAVGPDGKNYRTWHPQIDPVYWCYFHHEHGSDPGRHKPLFGYSTSRLGGEEKHEGFKVYTFNSPGNVETIVTHHFGTASAAKAACVRFHTFDMAIYKDGSLVADVHMMADHGKSQHARTDTDLTPPACPNQAAESDADNSNGVRKFQIATMDPVAYEPWRIDFAKIVIGDIDEFAVNTTSRITDCNSMQCDADVQTGDQGEFRFATYGPNFGIRAGARTGTFYTDPRGRAFRNEGDADALRQFVAPGANITLPPIAAADHECYTTHPFGGPYTCQATGPFGENMNIEGALRSPN